MLFDPRKLKELLEIAVGPLLALGALVGAVSAGINWLTPFLTDKLGLTLTLAQPLAIGLPLLAAVLMIWASYRAIAKKSRLKRWDRFDLRVRKPEDLIGREADAADLKSLIDDASLLLLDGESGSGKSALVEFGLVPRLKEDASLLPIVVHDYAGDWDTGLARRIFDAAWSALSTEERTKIGFSQRPAVGTVDAVIARRILEGIGEHLGRMPILILDQFDDYQLSAREQFLGLRKDWITPTELVQRNRSWAVLHDLLNREFLRLLVITRDDASAGLHSIRLTDRTRSCTVYALANEGLPQWIDQITKADDKGDVVANPEAGWTDLERQLIRDLTPKAPDGGPTTGVLPQQVRILFLGLRKLPSLTLADYRRAASGAGVEALFVRDAISAAASESKLSEADIRAVLSAFVDRSETNRLKTRVLSLPDLAFVDAARLQAALARLEKDEVVRERPALGEAGGLWQLDHDYIARAVVAEHRAANILTETLRDGDEAWRGAGDNLRHRYRSLLPLAMQMRLAWAWLRSQHQFTYRPYRVYAAFSLLRAVPVLLVAAGAILLLQEQATRTQVTQVVRQLTDQRYGDGSKPVVALWSAPAALRERVLEQFLQDPYGLRNRSVDLVRAYSSIEPEAAKDMAQRIVGRLADKDVAFDDARRSLLNALLELTGYLDAAPARELTKQLRVRLEGNSVDSDTWDYLTNAIGWAAGRFDASAASELTTYLLTRLDEEPDPTRQRHLISVLSSAARRLDPSAAAKLAEVLRKRLKERDIEWNVLIPALVSTTQQLDASAAARLVDDLRARLESDGGTDPDRARVIISALGQLGARLDAARAAQVAKELCQRLEGKELGFALQWELIPALDQLGSRLDAPDAAEITRDLWSRAQRGSRTTRQNLINALGRLASQLDQSAASNLVRDLRARLDDIKDSVDLGERQTLIAALGYVGARLDQPTAAALAKEMQGWLNDDNDKVKEALIYSISQIATGLDALAATEWTKILKTLLSSKVIDPELRATIAIALGNAGGRVDAPAAIELAKDLLARLETTSSISFDRQALSIALSQVSGWVDGPAATQLTEDLLKRLNSKDIDLNTRLALIDTTPFFVTLSKPDPTDREIAIIRIAMTSIAWPLRHTSQSPQWKRLETLSGEKFDRNIGLLRGWLNKCCKLSAPAARPTIDWEDLLRNPTIVSQSPRP